MLSLAVGPSQKVKILGELQAKLGPSPLISCTDVQKPTLISDAKEKVVADVDADNVIDDENEFILDAQEQDIPRVKAKPTNKSVPKFLVPNKPLPPMVQRSLFSFGALRHTRSSIKNPMHFGTAIIKTRMAMELGDRPADISGLKPPTKISDDLQESEALIDKNRLPLASVPGSFLGDSMPPDAAKHVLILTSWRSGSTFLGDILNHYPGTFYSFEPLHYISRMYKKANESLIYEKEIR